MSSDSFRKMAEQIDHNAQSGFGGAAVIVPPGDSGEVIELLLLDSKGDPAQFLSTLMTRIQLMVQDLEAQRAQPGFPRR